MPVRLSEEQDTGVRRAGKIALELEEFGSMAHNAERVRVEVLYASKGTVKFAAARRGFETLLERLDTACVERDYTSEAV